MAKVQTTKFSLIVLISGGGSNLQAIIDAINDDKLDARIAAVICNNNSALGIERAKKAGLNVEIISHKNYPDRSSFDQQMIKVIDAYQPDLLIMAGFMRILSELFIHHYEGKMINIHPSLLPKYKGLNTHQRVLDAGDNEHGLTVHYVTSELDSGPILKQVKIPIFKGDTKEKLAKRLLKQEHITYSEVIQCIVKERSITNY